MSPTKPTFLGIGGMKCGTTWISECLREHPEVFMSSPKELNYFSTKQYWDRGSEWYLDHFGDAAGYRAIGEFSTSYIRSSQTPPEKMIERIQGLLGHVRIIAAVRDPVARYVSNLKHFMREGRIPPIEPVSLAALREYNEKYPSLLQFGLLWDVIDLFRASFGPENVHVIAMEDCSHRPREVLRELYRFLEVSPNFTPAVLNRRISVGIVPRFVFLEKARLGIARYFYRHHPQVVDMVKKYHLSDLYRRLNARRPKVSSLLSDEARDHLRNFYEREVQRTTDNSKSYFQKPGS